MDTGHVWAQFLLGLLHVGGEVLPRNPRTAMYWFRKASAQEYAKVQYALGMVHAFGEGVVKDYVLAVHWWRKAA